MTVSDVLDLSAAQLNDVSQSSYTDTVLLPFFKQAYDELIAELQLHGLPFVKEVSAAVTVAAGTTRIYSGAGLPADLLYPIKLEERESGSTNTPQRMIEREWEPNTEQGISLLDWVWREDEIKLLGATTNREVFIYYVKNLAAIADGTSTISLQGVKNFLASRTAALAAEFIGENPTRATSLNLMAGWPPSPKSSGHLQQILIQGVRSVQALPARRRPFGASRRLRN